MQPDRDYWTPGAGVREDGLPIDGAHSWAPVHITKVGAQAPEPATLGGIAYPGRRHVYSGEPESLKSWVALILAAEQMRTGNTVLYIDLEMGARETLERLHALSLDDDTIDRHFVYLEPSEPITSAEILADVAALVAEREPSLVIVDATTGALSLHGLDANSAGDVERFYRDVIDPLREYGAAVILLDHLPKDRDSRGKFAIGSERKVGIADVHLRFETLQPFGRGKTGKAKITTQKDRPGYLPRPTCAEVELTSDPATGGITYRLEHAAHAESEPWRPTGLMEKVSLHLEALAEPASRNAILDAVRGKQEWVRTAIDELVRGGYATEEPGPRNARLVRSERPFRENQHDPVPPHPDPVPDTVVHPVPTLSPPYRGTGSSGDEVETTKFHDPVPDEVKAVDGFQPVPFDRAGRDGSARKVAR